MSASGDGVTAVFGAVGDISFAGPMLDAVEGRGADWVLDAVRPALARADVLFGNLECVSVPKDYPRAALEPGGLATPFNPAPVLRVAGFDVLNLANNHILDAGTTGLFHTVGAVEDSGITAIGVGATQVDARRMHTLHRLGLRWGFLAYAEDSNYTLSTTGPSYAYYDRADVLDDIRATRAEVDVLVVSVHADLEFMETPAPARLEAFREFAEAGATIVLGHHPHVPQGVELFNGSVIAYSLGNFVFHAHSSSYLRAHLPATADSFVLLARVGRTGVHDIELIPVVIGRPPAERPTIAIGRDRDELIARQARLDALLADGELVRANWRRESLRRALAAAHEAADVTGEADFLLRLGRLLYVAENRGWVTEVERAAEEVWERRRGDAHLLHRPSHGLDRRPRKSSGARRAVARLQLVARRLVSSSRV